MHFGNRVGFVFVALHSLDYYRQQEEKTIPCKANSRIKQSFANDIVETKINISVVNFTKICYNEYITLKESIFRKRC
jgi:hypothetical protein